MNERKSEALWNEQVDPHPHGMEGKRLGKLAVDGVFPKLYSGSKTA